MSGAARLNPDATSPHAGGAAPAAPGAYLLVLGLGRPVALAGRFAGTVLAPGTLLYAGSARGPGGLAARVGRHLRAGGRRHWHVDQLTRAPGVRAAALVWPDGDECAWRAALQAAGAGVPVPGFGSSDCRACPAHLLRLDGAAAGDPRLQPPGGRAEPAP